MPAPAPSTSTRRDGVKTATTVSASEAVGRGIVAIEAEPLAKGTYVLDWAVLSSMTVTPRAARCCSASGSARSWFRRGSDLPEAPGLLLRWLDLSAIMLAIGALAVSGRVLGSMGETGQRPAPAGPVHRSAVRGRCGRPPERSPPSLRTPHDGEFSWGLG